MSTRHLTTEQSDKVIKAAQQVMDGKATRVELHRRGSGLCVRVVIVEQKETVR